MTDLAARCGLYLLGFTITRWKVIAIDLVADPERGLANSISSPSPQLAERRGRAGVPRERAALAQRPALWETGSARRRFCQVVDTTDAVALIETAVPRRSETWADVGAGDGTFTRALAQLLGPDSRIYAIDRDARAVAALRRWAAQAASTVIPVKADFARPFELLGLVEPQLDGILLANSLHFVVDADIVLGRLAAWVRTGGRVVVVEYDRRAASRWVPYPIPAARLRELARSAGLAPPTIAATRPSAFGGVLYVAAVAVT